MFKSTVFCSLVCALSAGCEKTVVLGSECPTQEGPCESITRLPGPDLREVDANAVGGAVTSVDSAGIPVDTTPPSDDAGFRAPDESLPIDVPPADAGSPGPTIDAAPPTPPDAGDASTGLLQNPSFELRDTPVFGVVQNQFDLDVLVSDLAGYVPSAGEFFANIDPWFACWVGAKVESNLAIAGTVGGLPATVGEALITTEYGPPIWLPGLFQILAEPLQAGKTYSFALDVINSGNGRSALWIGATNLPCTMPTVYAATPEITNRDSWREYCVSFRASRSFSTFALVPVDVADGSVGQVSFDNLRQVDRCP